MGGNAMWGVFLKEGGAGGAQIDGSGMEEEAAWT